MERMLCVRGRSMRPFLKDGDKVLFRPGKKDFCLRPGDIGVFNYGTCLVIHRVVDILYNDGRKIILEKGDNMLFPSAIEFEDVVGKVTRIYNCCGCVDFLRLKWRIINITIGYYNKILFRVIGLIRIVKRVEYFSFIEAGEPGRRIMVFFISLPKRFLKGKAC